jgi:hypothetical protein
MAIPPSAKATPRKLLLVPLVWSVQVAPSSVVRRIVPALPTATAVCGPNTTSPITSFPVGSGFCQDQSAALRLPPLKQTNALDKTSIRLLKPELIAIPLGLLN